MNAKTILEILEALVRKCADSIMDEMLEIDQDKQPYTYYKLEEELEHWGERLILILKQQKEEEQIQHCRMSLG